MLQPPVTWSPLQQRASEVRALSRALQVRCPDPLHGHAIADVPCYPPSGVHSDGWICIERIAREMDTRAEREHRQRVKDARLARPHIEERLRHKRVAMTSRIAAAIPAKEDRS